VPALVADLVRRMCRDRTSASNAACGQSCNNDDPDVFAVAEDPSGLVPSQPAAGGKRRINF